MLVPQRCRVGADPDERPWAVDRVVRAPPEARDRIGREHDVAGGSELLAEADGRAAVAERDELVADVLEVDRLFVPADGVEGVLPVVGGDLPAGDPRDPDARESGPRIISSTQRTFRPTTIAVKPSPPKSRRTWVAQGVPSGATKCTSPSPGTIARTRPPRATRVGLTTSVEPGAASMRVASSCSASRVSASPIWRASW